MKSKTIREVFGYNYRCDVYSDGSLYQSSSGLLYPEDEIWRVKAHIEFQKVESKPFHIIYDYVESVCGAVNNKEFETLYRFYPVFGTNGYCSVVINGKTTSIRVGKLLKRCFTLSDFHIRELVDSLTISEGATTVELTRNKEEILGAYKRVRSCMSSGELPLMYLQDKACYLAVVKQQGKVIGRSWIRNGERTTIYAFGLYKDIVIQALSCFSETSYFLEDVRFYSFDGRFPYLDSCYGRVNYSDSVVTITPAGDCRISEQGYIIKG